MVKGIPALSEGPLRFEEVMRNYKMVLKEIARVYNEAMNIKMCIRDRIQKERVVLNDLIAEVTADMELKPADQRLRVNIDFPQQVEIVGSPSLLASISVSYTHLAGCYHETAARGYFADREIEVLPCLSFDELFARMAADPALLGIAAIENTIAGSLLPNHRCV